MPTPIDNTSKKKASSKVKLSRTYGKTNFAPTDAQKKQAAQKNTESKVVSAALEAALRGTLGLPQTSSKVSKPGGVLDWQGTINSGKSPLKQTLLKTGTTDTKKSTKKAPFEMQGKAALPQALTGKSTGPAANGTGYAGTPDAGDPDDGAPPSLLDTLAKLQQAGASTKTLKSYLKDAMGDLGPGTNYGAIVKQLTADNGIADQKMQAIYGALATDLKGNDSAIQGIYDDASKQYAQNSANAAATINGAYDASRAQEQQAVQASGGPGSETAGQFAANDQARANANLAQSTGAYQDYNTSLERGARSLNNERVTSAYGHEAEERSSLLQALAQQKAKLTVQQSTEDASRRAQALQLAMQMQSNDQSAASASVSQMLQAMQDDITNKRNYRNDQSDQAAAAAGASQKAIDSSNAQALALYKIGLDPVTGKPLKSAAKKDRANLYTKVLSAAGGNTATADAVMKNLGY